ncbi:MAG: A24 family peptidase [Carboxydocellales bacterium]
MPALDIITLIPGIFLLCLMIIIAIIDYRQQIIPNKLILVGTIMGTVLNLAVGKLSLLEMIIGLASGGTVLLVIAVISKGGMGGGDVKLAAMLGIYLGWEHTLQTIFLASLLAALTGLVLMLAGKANRTTAIPFGPFLAISTFGLFLGQSLINNWN